MPQNINTKLGGTIYNPTQLSTPITIPPVAAATADSIWILTINCNLTQGPNVPTKLWLSICPMDSASGTLYTDQIQNIVIDDVMGAAATDSNISDFMDNLQAMVLEYCQNNGIFGMAAQVTSPPVLGG